MLKQALLSFVQERVSADAGAMPIGENDPLIDRGLIDSIALLQIMLLIEEKTGIRIPDDEVLPENFQTVASMERLVRRLEAGR